MPEGMYHLSARTGSRSGGQSAGAHVRYEMREGEYSRQPDKLLYTESGNMPGWAQQHPLSYWEAADTYERRNGRLFKTLDAALPQQLEPAERRDLACQLAHELTQTDEGPLPYSLSVHEGYGENPHLHLTISERVNDGIARDASLWFRRANKSDPERGGAIKTRALKPKAWLENTRARWAEMQNEQLRRHGHDITVDHRSYADRGIEKQAGRHLGPVVTAIEKCGVKTDRGDEIRKESLQRRGMLRELGTMQMQIHELQQWQCRKGEMTERKHRYQVDPKRRVQRIQKPDRVHINRLVEHQLKRLESIQERAREAAQRYRAAEAALHRLPSREQLVRSTRDWKKMEARHNREKDALTRELQQDHRALTIVQRNRIWRGIDWLTRGHLGPIAAARRDLADTRQGRGYLEQRHWFQQEKVRLAMLPKVERYMKEKHQPVEKEYRTAEKERDNIRGETRRVRYEFETLETIQHLDPHSCFERGTTFDQIEQQRHELEDECGIEVSTQWVTRD